MTERYSRRDNASGIVACVVPTTRNIKRDRLVFIKNGRLNVTGLSAETAHLGAMKSRTAVRVVKGPFKVAQ